jgi:hypothetical protein
MQRPRIVLAKTMRPLRAALAHLGQQLTFVKGDR